MKQPEIDAAPPTHDLFETVLSQFRLDRRRRDQDGRRRPVKTTQETVAPAFRDRPARRDILGKAGVVARGEGALLGEADCPRQPADRPFGGDMGMVRCELGDPAGDRPARRERDPDIGIARQADLPEAFGRQHPRFEAEFGPGLDHSLQRPDDPVDLGPPGVRRDHQAHQAASTSAGCGLAGTTTGTGASPLSRYCGQRIISKRPS